MDVQSKYSSDGNANISGNYFSQQGFYPRRITACPCTSRPHGMFLRQTPRGACFLTVTADAASTHQRMHLHLSHRQTELPLCSLLLNNFPLFGPAFLKSPPAHLLPLGFPINESSPFRGRCVKRLLQMWQMC